MLRRLVTRVLEDPLGVMWDAATLAVVAMFCGSLVAWLTRAVIGVFQ